MRTLSRRAKRRHKQRALRAVKPATRPLPNKPLLQRALRSGHRRVPDVREPSGRQPSRLRGGVGLRSRPDEPPVASVLRRGGLDHRIGERPDPKDSDVRISNPRRGNPCSPADISLFSDSGNTPARTSRRGRIGDTGLRRKAGTGADSLYYPGGSGIQAQRRVRTRLPAPPPGLLSQGNLRPGVRRSTE